MDFIEGEEAKETVMRDLVLHHALVGAALLYGGVVVWAVWYACRNRLW